MLETEVINWDGFESPSWHEEELKRTEALVRDGKTDFVDWDEAKKKLRLQLTQAIWFKERPLNRGE